MKLGIIGTGKIVEEALPVLKANGYIQLAGICAVNNKDKATLLARKYNINKVIYYEQILFHKINIMYGKNYLFL